MRLVFTSYLDCSPEEIERRATEAFPAAVSAAAARIKASTSTVRAETRPAGVVLQGLEALDGTEITWAGDDSLTTVRILVPWQVEDNVSGDKLRAASQFAEVFSAVAGGAA